MMEPIAKANAFQRLHHGPRILEIANAWDAASARVFEQAGMRAIGTGSAGIAFSHGYPDNERIPRDMILAATREIVRAVDVPVTADILTGLGGTTEAVVATVMEVIALGAVGVNIEDGVGAPELLCRKIEAVRAAAERAGVKLFINARCDVYLRKLAEGEAALAETLKRGKLYRDAGADGLFVPFATDAAVMSAVIAEVKLPFNAIARKGLPPFAELRALGVRRLSAGTGISRAAFEATRAAAAQFLADGDSDALVARGGAPSDLNALFKDKS